MLVCKFYVSNIARNAPHDLPAANVTMAPVISHCDEDGKFLEENANWSAWTPSGSIQLTITNPLAIDELQVGKSYLIGFQPAYD